MFLVLMSYGNTNYVVQYINEEFPGVIKWDRNTINVTSIDIETKFGDGFPEPKDADQEVTAITMKNNIDDIYYTFGCGEYDVENSTYANPSGGLYQMCR